MSRFMMLLSVLLLLCGAAGGAESTVTVDGKTMTPEEAWRYIQQKSKNAQAKTAAPPAGETKTGVPPAGEAKKTGEADLLGDAGKAAPAAAGKEKLPDPRLTPEEKDTLALAVRAAKLGRVSPEQARGLRTLAAAVATRLWTGAAELTTEEYKQRVAIAKELLDTLEETRTGIGLSELSEGARPAQRAWLASAGEDMQLFLARLELVGKHGSIRRGWTPSEDSETLKAAVVAFMEQGKYRDTPPTQKIKFVQAYVIPRVPTATAEFNRLIEFYKEEAKAVPGPAVNKTPDRR